MMRYFLIFLLVGMPPAYAECFSWEVARAIILHEKLISGTKAYRAAAGSPAKPFGVTSLNLCHEKGRFIYRARTVDSDNQIETVIIDAKTGYRK